MNQMYNEVEVLEQSFQALEVGDFELKVENIKKRINLLRQKVGYDDKSKLIKAKNEISQASVLRRESDLQEMASLRNKLKPKVSNVETEMEKTDRELDEALQRAFEKING
tara:strand:+ start:269 stop:598 length:330 start_codon:yes stop_codon:yes gene_type:complete